MYIKTKISLNFFVMSLLMIGTGAGYLFTSLYMQKKLDVMSNAALPAMQKLNSLRSNVWGLWELRDDEAASVRAFRELEQEILDFRNLSIHEDAEALSIGLRSGILELHESFDVSDYAGFVSGADRINLLISQAMEGETSILLRKGREVNGVVDYANSMNMAFVAIALLFCLLPGWWLASNISKALGSASRAADRIAAGDLTERLNDKGNDEISELANAFNRMVDTIRQADEEISREVQDRVRAEKRAQIAAQAKSDFLAHMSHEFRTPLNGILGYSQLLSMDKGLSGKNREVVLSLRRSGESLLELINDVLDLTKIEAQKMNVQKNRFYLGDFLDSLVESYSEQVHRKGLTFQVQLDENLPEDILSDDIRLRQILVNLLGNALKFTDKGSIGLEVKPIEGGLRFSVMDSGIGIDPKFHSAVMQPFNQIEHRDRKNQGTGLGLPISNRLLQMMGTHLNIKSEIGEGTTFWFDLPQPDVKHRKLVHVPTQITGYRGKARKILIGEEGLGTATLMMPLLQKVGFETLHLRTPETFLEKCEFFQPDVVLLDLYFCDADGVEVMRELEKIYDRNPENQMPGVFMFSDHRDPLDRERALKSGADSFLGVPIRFTDLLMALRDQLDLVWSESSSEESEGDSGEKETAGNSAAEIIPDMKFVEALLIIARSGNIRQLNKKLTEVKDACPESMLFLERMEALCGQYKINAIQKELESYLSSTDRDQHEGAKDVT
ncbi:ATP-binding protein [Kiritimatiellaeota bacterium B1221]|nr:ATP-binding protein [Kiritimatiellaeota bacterium B1221]